MMRSRCKLQSLVYISIRDGVVASVQERGVEKAEVRGYIVTMLFGAGPRSKAAQ